MPLGDDGEGGGCGVEDCSDRVVCSSVTRLKTSAAGVEPSFGSSFCDELHFAGIGDGEEGVEISERVSGGDGELFPDGGMGVLRGVRGRFVGVHGWAEFGAGEGHHEGDEIGDFLGVVGSEGEGFEIPSEVWDGSIVLNAETLEGAFLREVISGLVVEVAELGSFEGFLDGAIGGDEEGCEHYHRLRVDWENRYC